MEHLQQHRALTLCLWLSLHVTPWLMLGVNGLLVVRTWHRERVF